jgi:O-antigen/teichoic acid export membrane protein
MRFAASSGTIRVGAGLLALGLTSYVFLTVAARHLSPTAFASLSVLWSASYIVGPGFFQPFEQQIGRALSAHRAIRSTAGFALRHAVRSAAVILLALSLITLTFARPLARLLFDGSLGLLMVLVITFGTLAVTYVYRGVLAGEGRFDLYGAQLGIEGTARLVGCGLLVLLGTGSVAAYVMLVPLAQAVSLLLVIRPGVVRLAGARDDTRTVGARRRVEGDEPPADRTLMWLVVAAVLSQTLVNAAIVLVHLLGKGDPGAAGHLLAGLTVARLPLFVFAAVQAVLLPGFAALLAVRATEALRRRVLLVCAATAAAMAIATTLIGFAGPWAVRVLFGDAFDLSGTVLAALAAGTGLFMIATVLANAVMAALRFRTVAICWACGVAVMLAVIAAPMSLIARAVGGFVVGAGISCGLLALAFNRYARSAEPPRVTIPAARAARIEEVGR